MADLHPKRAFDFRRHQTAVIAVAIAVPISLLASAVLWVIQGVVATTMLKGAVFAVVAAYPVWRAYRRMLQAERVSRPASA